MEIWRDIEGYEGLYQVSNLGNVKSLNYRKTGKEQILQLAKNQDGYLCIDIYKNKKRETCRINRLVAVHFIPIPERLKNIPIEKLDVGHLKKLPDGTEDKTANEVWNLAWMSKSENQNYGTHNERIRKTLLNREDCSKPVLQIDKYTNEIIAEFPSASEVQRQFGFLQSQISLCCNGKNKQAYGFKWKYKNG